jgi:hypothetical protein
MIGDRFTDNEGINKNKNNNNLSSFFIQYLKKVKNNFKQKIVCKYYRQSLLAAIMSLI